MRLQRKLAACHASNQSQAARSALYFLPAVGHTLGCGSRQNRVFRMKTARVVLVSGFSISVLLGARVLAADALTSGAEDPNALSHLHLQNVGINQLFTGLAEGNGVVVAAASGTILVSTDALQWSRDRKSTRLNSSH